MREELIRAGDEGGQKTCSGYLRTSCRYRRGKSFGRYFESLRGVSRSSWSTWFGKLSNFHIHYCAQGHWLSISAWDYQLQTPEERRCKLDWLIPHVHQSELKGSEKSFWTTPERSRSSTMSNFWLPQSAKASTTLSLLKKILVETISKERDSNY